ncbi:phosphoinositide phosphatase SAC8 isoform X1 [Cryptomeria japonica]|uniref:phosphoinositide phosphatase SAC8 isoform X1 n=1 Tax=Cryptomeria japonica TaxID=3369 RepID=UPI0025AC0904|nr:phosphoinositide phosphatase SAC8 isoform X1 [Cryptomeria japonica]
MMAACEKEMAHLAHQGKIYDEMQLLVFEEDYIVKPSDGHPLSISRLDGSLKIISEADIGSNPTETTLIYGVVGTIRLLAGTYILVVTSRQQMGMHRGFSVYRITSMKFLSCNKVLKLSSLAEKRDEAYFVSLLKTVEKTPGLYYSYETDLTLNVQRIYNLEGLKKRSPLWKQADPRYVWNRSLIEELIEAKLEPYILPVIQGSFQTIQVKLKEKLVTVTLISRRCTRRIGTRMWRRGANLEGHVANFIETEQLLEVEGFTGSYLQVRGSIPVLWEQIVDLTYKPKLNIINTDKTPKVVQRHFYDLVQRYGSIVAIDLVDQKGSEGSLSLVYADAMQHLKHIRYVPFDFHHICGHLHFERLQLLYEQIAEELQKQGCFLQNSDGKSMEEQTGILRVNCIDCLDRTNVTQSLLGQKVLDYQLNKIGLFTSSECISQHSDFHQQFKILWANHGDEISLQYSGTHALKGDFVRYGRQTVSGLIKDGFSALARYYLNNFHDGIRQDAMDLVAGYYTVSRGIPSPFQLNGFELFAYLPIASALIVGALTITTFSLQQAADDTQNFLFSVVWGGLTAGVMAVVKANGRQFCSRPRLCKLF